MSSNDRPYFSVIMATYGRGRHIAPSIRSVLDQSFGDFELLVVGDRCTDDTEQAVRSFGDPRIRWINLSERCGSQSAPNNAGILASTGDRIAYLGHDDIWEPGHLMVLSCLFDTKDNLDFAVSGAVFHLPNGIAGSQVTGLFEDESAKHSHFFPPSSFSHRRSVPGRIGAWNMPGDIKAPVDADFLLRAAAADLSFASTGRITVHKFAAGHRYLSYLEQTSHEQIAMLASIREPDHSNRVEKMVSDAKTANSFMIIRHGDFSTFAVGELARQNAARKGLREINLLPLGRGARLRQTEGPHALDWEEKPKEGILWTRLNPQPNLHLPYAARGHAIMEISVFHANSLALRELELFCNGTTVATRRMALEQHVDVWTARFNAVITLKPDGPSVLQFCLTAEQAPSSGGPGIGVGEIYLCPAARWTKCGPGILARLTDAWNRRRLDLLRREMSRADVATSVNP